jgi:hypothetical protein
MLARLDKLGLTGPADLSTNHDDYCMEISSPLISADSSALISLAIRSDRNHSAATDIVKQVASDNPVVL